MFCVYVYINIDRDIDVGKMRVYGRKRGKERYL